MVKIEDIKELRNLTGVSLEACRQALEETEGGIAGAIEILKSRGESLAAKKSGRETNQGLIVSYIHLNGKIGVLVKLLSETDFVAQNELFGKLAHDLAMHIAATDPQNIEELLKEPFVKDESLLVDDLIKSYVSRLGENIRVGEFCRFSI